jgi:hypothetical protein
MALTRAQAIEILAAHDLRRGDRAWRSDELYCISASAMDDHPDWVALPQSLRDEIEGLDFEEIADPEHPRFDPVLLLSLKAGYVGATNAFLASRLIEIGNTDARVDGDVEDLIACPCCGRKSLSSRGEYEICTVCWWEDDGQDNPTASQVAGGPNRGLSLTQARLNFLMHGIYDPARTDLRQFQVVPEKYVTGRLFVLTDDQKISETGTDWCAPVD